MISSSYRFPGEFEQHRSTWLLWPTRPDNWRDNASYAQKDVLALAKLISRYEPVKLAARPNLIPKLKTLLPTNIELVGLLFDDIWVRDTGPTILLSTDNTALGIDWRFNSWGGLFDQHQADDRVAQQILASEHIDSITSDLTIEGGAIATDGAGTLILTEESLLSEARNPGLSKKEATSILRSTLNTSNVIWLPQGLANDESGGHVDNVCAFASPSILVLAIEDDKDSPSYDALLEAKRILRRSRSADGSTYDIVEIPLPAQAQIESAEAIGFARPNGKINRAEGHPLAPSHVNFYIVNGAIIVPTFGSWTDDVALRRLREACPQRDVIGFPSRELLLGGGAVHCVTKEIPL